MDWRFAMVAGFAAWLCLGVAIGAALSPVAQHGRGAASSDAAGQITVAEGGR